MITDSTKIAQLKALALDPVASTLSRRACTIQSWRTGSIQAASYVVWKSSTPASVV